MRVQAGVTGSSTSPSIQSMREKARDIDYLVARLHARRSTMAEAERLDSLCRIRNLPEFFRTIYPDSEIKEIVDFQRLAVQKLIGEVSGLRAYITGPGAVLLERILVRFQAENLKVLLRACLSKAPAEAIEGHLVSLPAEFALNTPSLSVAESLADFVRSMPKGLLQGNMERALIIYADNPRPFFMEAALDRGYLLGLVAGTEGLPQEERQIVGPMVYQEADIFHLMLVARGKFYYNLTPGLLRPLHVEGTRIPGRLFTLMLSSPDLSTSIGLVAERVLDAMPLHQGPKDPSMTMDAVEVEALAWKRFLHLANLAFRRSHMGLGAVMGYAGLRRIEVANLITMSEGIRRNMTPEAIRERLIPRTLFKEEAP